MPIHIVSSGDTPRSIARSYGVSVSRLLYDNQLTDQDSLIPGQALLVLIPAVTHQVRGGRGVCDVVLACSLLRVRLNRHALFGVNQVLHSFDNCRCF